jgi:hypothetical protein
MAASEFVELELEQDNNTIEIQHNVNGKIDEQDDQSFLQNQDYLQTEDKKAKQTQLKSFIYAGVGSFVFFIIIVIIIAVSNGTTNNSIETVTITQKCLKPTDTSIDKGTLYLLQGYYAPTSYDIFFGFNPNWKGNTEFTSVDILLKSQKRQAYCDWVWLNTDQTRIFDLSAKASIYDDDAKEISSRNSNVLQIVHHPTIDVVGVQLAKSIVNLLSKSTSLSLVLHLRYRLSIGSQLDGIYLSKWTDDENNNHTIIASQMEATSARKAFPSVDQPLNKATFTVHVGCDDCDQYTILSNMPTTTTNINEWALTTKESKMSYTKKYSSSSRLISFNKTPLMSRFFVFPSICVCDYS